MRYLLPILLLLASCVHTRGPATSSFQPLPRSAWNAAPPRPFKQHTPVRITVHHEGTALADSSNGIRKIKGVQSWGMGPDRGWADVPYHFLIAPNGAVYEGRSPYTVGETATEYDPTGHLLITCLGNREASEVPPAQLEALIQTIAWASKKFGIPLQTLSTHRDHSTQTGCPGKYLYRYFQDSTVQRKAMALGVGN